MKKENIARFYYLMIFMVAPLYLSRGYSDVLAAKTYIVWLSIIVTFVLVAYAAGCALWELKKTGGTIDLGSWLTGFVRGMSTVDIAVGAFGLIAVLSAMSSEWPQEAWSGQLGWNVGGYMLLALTVLYFILSRVTKREELPFYGMLVGGFAVMVLGVLNDLWIDPLGTMAPIDIFWKDTFTSTIGNVTNFAGYLSIVIPVAAALFVHPISGFKRVLVGIVLLVGYMNIFLTHADSIYFAVGISLVFLLWYCLRDSGRYLMFLINGIMIGVAGYIVQLLLMFRPETKVDEISPILLTHHVHLVTGAVSLVLLLVHMAVSLRIPAERITGWLTGISRIYAVCCVLGFVAALVYVIRHFEPTFLNRRGVMWEIVWHAIQRGDLREKLIGLGPGNYDQFSKKYMHLIVKYYGRQYTLRNAHNDIFEYLATTGILGAAAYAGIYATTIISFFLRLIRGKMNDVAAVAFLGLLGYMAQSMMNGPYPLMTAMFYGLLAIFAASGREATETARLSEGDSALVPGAVSPALDERLKGVYSVQEEHPEE